MSFESKFQIDGQWFYRGNASPLWVALGSRPDGSASGIAERVPRAYWFLLDHIAELRKTNEERRAGILADLDIPKNPRTP